MSGVLALGPAQRLPQRPGGEFAGQVPLVVGRAALVRVGRAVLGRDLAGPDEARLSGRRAAQELLGLGRGEMLRADGGEADPGIGDAVTVQPDSRPGRAHRPVAYPAPDLLVRAAAAGPDRDPDLGQQL